MLREASEWEFYWKKESEREIPGHPAHHLGGPRVLPVRAHGLVFMGRNGELVDSLKYWFVLESTVSAFRD